MKQRTSKIAVFATCLGIAGAFPVLSSADQGGIPNSHSNGNASKPCPTHGKGTSKDINTLPSQARDKGKKCGFQKGGLTIVSSPTS